MKRALLLATLLGACATTPAEVYELVDAPDASARAEAAHEASELLVARRRPLAVRLAAARTLGRLRFVDAVVVEALQRTLLADEPRELRAYAAWALGEYRSPLSLSALSACLKQRLDPLVAEYVMEALAKHYAVMSKDQDTLVEIVEALVYFSGNHTGALPATYDLLSANTRTVTVNIEVLKRTLERASATATPEDNAAMYSAAYELLARLDDTRDEIVAGEAAWQTRVKSAVDTSARTLGAEDPRTALLVVWYLGRLAELPQLARPSAGAILEPNDALFDERAAHRLVATWALARMQVHALGPRQALLVDVLSKEIEPAVLALLGDLSARDGSFDQLQKILGVGAKP